MALVPAPRPVSAQTAGCGAARHPGVPGKTVDYVRAFAGENLTHRLALPPGYSASSPPAPLLLFFHGWMSDSGSCGALCDSDAPALGFITLSVQGMGAIGGGSAPSWNGSGSVASPGSRGATCQPDATSYCYDDCAGACADNCWWTTCLDSVGEVVDTLNALEAALCVDTSMVWASGFSNGGIFTYQLAQDPRLAPRLAGLLPISGLPHIGFLGAPRANPRMSYLANLGSLDTTVPPFCNTNESDRSLDTSSQPGGWYYQTGRSTSDSFAAIKGCSGPRVNASRWRIGEFAELSCTMVQGCPEGDVVECLGPHGHVFGLAEQRAPLLAFALDHPLKAEAVAEAAASAEVPR
jgi:polyhydroxybutyrate depolymerase